MNYTPSDSAGKASMTSSNRPPADLMGYSTSSVNSKKNAFGPSSSKSRHRTLEYYFSKKCYQRTVKRLMEDPSSIWYDNLEQMKKDYNDMKEVYDIVSTFHAQDDLEQCEWPAHLIE